MHASGFPVKSPSLELDPSRFLESVAESLDNTAIRDELRSIGKEQDTDLFFPDLLSFGHRLQLRGKVESAARLYDWLAKQNSAPLEISQAAHRALNALEGKGDMGSRAEILLAQVAKDAVSPTMILPMMGASVIGGVSKAIAMSQLSRLPVGLLTRGTGAKIFSSAAAFGVEGMTFAGLGRSLASGHSGPFGAELASSYLGLGALKFSGSLARRLIQPILKRYPALGSHFAITQFAPQLSIFLGLMLAHKVEIGLGLRPASSLDHELADTLAATVSLQLGAKLGHAALGKGRVLQDLVLRVQSVGAIPTTPPRSSEISPIKKHSRPAKQGEVPIVTTQFLPTLSELFRRREKALEDLAGSLLIAEAKDSGSDTQPAQLLLSVDLPQRAPSAPAPSAPRAEMSGERGPGFGPRLEMRLDLSPTIEIQPRLELDDESRRQMGVALQYWETRPHSEIKFPLGVLMASLGISGKAETKAMMTNDFAAEFIVVSREEFKSLDAEEKGGVLLGDCIIVSAEVPEAYLPMVVANLAFLRKIRDDNDFKGLVRAGRISVDESRHWTANILDLTMAKEYFTDSPGEYAQFLQWRKQVERTDFFKHPEVDEILKGKLRYQNYKRTTHPLQRNLYARKSWVIGGLLHMLGTEATEQAKIMGVTKADIIVREIAAYRHESFDPEYMMRLIQALPELVQTRRVLAKKQNYLDLSNSQEFLAQARLLTEGVVGRDSAILAEIEHSGVFVLKLQYMSSMRALSDRLVFFLREGMLHSGLTRKTLLFLRGAMPLLTEAPDRPVSLQLQGGQERTSLKIRIRELNKQIRDVQASLDRYLALRIKYVDMGSVEYIPGPIDEQYGALLRLKEKLDGDFAELNEAYRLLDDAGKLFREQRALLGALIATEDPARKPEPSN